MRRVGEIILWALVVCTPLALGGVHPVVFVAAAATGGIALALVSLGRSRRGMPAPAAGLALLAATLWALATALPLPAGLVSRLSPRALALASLPPELPAASAALSLDPPATLVQLARLAALAAVLLAAAGLARRPPAARRLAAAVAVAGGAALAVGVFHAAAQTDLLYGFHPGHAAGLLPGPFVRPSHAASLFDLSSLAALGLAAASAGPPRMAWSLVSGACAAGTLVTQSVEGIAGLLVGLALFGLLLARRRWEIRSRALVALAVAAGVVGAAVLVVEHAPGEAGAGQADRWAVLPGALRLVTEQWAAGVGAGAFSFAYMPYAPLRTVRLVTHPENLLLQWAAEWGIFAALVGVAALAWTLRRSVRAALATDNDAARCIADGLLAGIGAVLAADLAGFSLEFLGVGLPFAVALGVVAGRDSGPMRLDGRAMAVVGIGIVGLATVAALAGQAQADARLADLLARGPSLETPALDDAYREVRRRHPADGLVVLRAGNALLARSEGLDGSAGREALQRALPHLARAQELDTSDDPHLLAARALFRLGRRSQAMTELRRAYALAVSPLSAIDEALRAGIGPDDLATLPAGLAGLQRDAPELDLTDVAEAESALVRVLLQERGRPLLALRTARRLRAGDPDAPRRGHADAALLLATCEAALRDADCAERSEPNCSPPDEAVARWEEAADLGRALVAAIPGDERAWLCVIEAESRAGHGAQAVAFLLQGRERLPASLTLLLRDAQERLAEGRAPEVAELLTAVSDGGDAAAAAKLARLRVEAFLSLGRTARAAAETDAIVRSWPAKAWAWALAARVREASGQVAHALDALRTAESVSGPAEVEAVRSERRRIEALRPAGASQQP